jgi:hypothetical protein
MRDDVRQPEPPLLRRLAHLEDGLDEESTVALALVAALLVRPHHLLDELAHLEPQLAQKPFA